MKIAVVCPDYPSESAHSYAFVHARIKLYQKAGQVVHVFVKSERSAYQFEGVSVTCSKKSRLRALINEFHPDVVAVFYPIPWMVSLLNGVHYPIVVWVLGHELLWNFRLGSSKGTVDWLKKRVVLLPRLVYQIYVVRQFLVKAEYLIFVSKWLLKASEKHGMCRFEKAVVIPNPVDTSLFSYRVPRNMKQGLSLRSLQRSVYGLDVAIKAFSNYGTAKLTIIGRGRFLKRYSRMIRRLHSNTTILCEHKNHDQLPALYHKYGFFVAPSREETQGLAMCEAMACGLPVVATNVGGIPEFVRDGVDGYLVPPNDPQALRRAVERLVSDQKRFFAMSVSARHHIEQVCASETITMRELQILEKAQQHNGEPLCPS